jgi:hypothetical protein
LGRLVVKVTGVKSPALGIVRSRGTNSAELRPVAVAVALAPRPELDPVDTMAPVWV